MSYTPTKRASAIRTYHANTTLIKQLRFEATKEYTQKVFDSLIRQALCLSSENETLKKEYNL